MSPQKLSQCDNFVYLSPYRLDVAKTRLIVDMGLQNLQAKGGRIVKSIVPSPETRYLSCSGTRYHGHMAPTFGRKFLTCFYCNKKSGIKYDGLIQQWECGNCESMNFLDENGEITDPPVASEDAAPLDRSFALARPDSPPSSQESQTSLFCPTCLKNQHLYTASLSQFDIDLDPHSPHFKENEHNYRRYKRKLESLYPQVCVDCEPKVLEQLKRAEKTAKTDYLQKLMEKSRVRRPVSQKLCLTLSIESIGKLLWYIGLLGQLLWHIVVVAPTVQLLYPSTTDALTSCFSWIPLHFGKYLIPLSASAVARSSLICSFLSIWWNPKFKQLKNGFINHIRGYRDWYKYQTLLLAIRCLGFYFMGNGLVTAQYAVSSITAHAFVFGFVTYLGISSHYSLKVDMTPLWASTPEKLSNVGPSTSPNNAVNPMIQALNEISGTPSRRSYQAPPPSSTPPYGINRNTQVSHTSPDPDLQNTYGLTKLNLQLQPRQRSPPTFVQHDTTPMEEMDWSPSQPTQSQHRAFASTVNRKSLPFGQTPVASPESHVSPFWYKVPPAPIAPAHQLRNPRNQPRLRIASQEVKENFFKNVTRRGPSQDSTSIDVPRRDMFAQQTFFPPSSPSESGNSLADLLTSFSLGPSDSESPTPIRHSSRKAHVWQSVVLLMGSILWNHALYQPFEETLYVLVGVLVACALIGLRTIQDNTVFSAQKDESSPAQLLGMCLGTWELFTAIYGIVEVLGRNGDYANCASRGSLFIGGMMVHEILVVLMD